jgi:hypothetical protein
MQSFQVPIVATASSSAGGTTPERALGQPRAYAPVARGFPGSWAVSH